MTDIILDSERQDGPGGGGQAQDKVAAHDTTPFCGRSTDQKPVDFIQPRLRCRLHFPPVRISESRCFSRHSLIAFFPLSH